MNKVIDLWEWKRTRRGEQRARPQSRRERRDSGFVRIDDATSAVVLRLRR